MIHRMRTAVLVVGVLALSSAAARAQSAPPPPPPAAEEPAAAPAEAVAATPAATSGSGTVYGAGARLRWVSVPNWLLGLFLKQSVPLSSYGFGGEVFRRNGDLDMVLGLSYQKMGPPDGNWLGRGKAASVETDFLQFRNFGFVGVDASFIWRTVFNQNVALRYGAGLGLAFVTGKILRVSNAGCTEQNAGNTRDCRPIYCPPTGCSEAMHLAREGQPDNGPTDPHRFSEGDVPGAIPIINMLIGLDFHIPNVKGLELRVEGGFYNAFFAGIATTYLF